jgi:hypothetical protein
VTVVIPAHNEGRVIRRLLCRRARCVTGAAQIERAQGLGGSADQTRISDLTAIIQHRPATPAPGADPPPAALAAAAILRAAAAAAGTGGIAEGVPTRRSFD